MPQTNADCLNVKDFGAHGNGSKDDTAAVERAFAAIPRSGGCIYFPRGTYELRRQIGSRDRSVTVLGDGPDVSNIRWTNPRGGMSFSFDNVNTNLTITGLSLLTRTSGGGKAIRARWPDIGSSTFGACSINQVEIRGVNGFSHYWNEGIVIENGWNTILDAIWIRGRANTLDSDYAVRLGGNSTNTAMSRINISFAKTGIEVTGATEGTNIDQCYVLYTNYGVRAHLTNQVRPYLTVKSSHFDVLNAGITTQGRPQSFFDSNLIYRRENHAFTGISLGDGCQDTHVTNNMIVDPEPDTPGSKNGLVITGTAGRPVTSCHLLGNKFTAMDTGIWLKPYSSRLLVANNLFTNCGTRILNQGATSGERIHHNF